MTGKRPRALSRTASVSQLGSGNLSQEFSPLPENPKEKLKPTVINKEPSPTALPSPRVVIGFDPKPFESSLSPKSAPCSPSFNEKASSPRSVLNSLFSRHQRVAKPSDGVGLGIALAEDTPDIVIPVVSPREIPVVHQRRHSHPIPTPGISPCRLQDARVSPQRKACNQPRAVLAWMEPVDRRDTFLLAETPVRGSVMTGDVAAALTASSHFLDECSFCKRHLPEDKDIFMYRYPSHCHYAFAMLFLQS
jgi:hypothetical protein